MRLVVAAASSSWVTMTMVWPRVSHMRTRVSSRLAAEAVSRAPVGSSAKMTSGRPTRARATATRCCWPPESSVGRCVRRSPMPRVVMTASYQALSGLRWANRRGSRMLSCALSVGSRLKDWKMKPSLSRRTRVSRLSFMAARSSPVMRIWPAVGVSRPARQCRRVDLPEPEGPMMAANSPGRMARLTPSRATTRASPWPYAFVTPRASTTGPAGAVMCCDSVTLMGRSTPRIGG